MMHGCQVCSVLKLTGTFEGNIIRTLRRLDELIRQIATASKAIGNHELQAKFEKDNASSVRCSFSTMYVSRLIRDSGAELGEATDLGKLRVPIHMHGK